MPSASSTAANNAWTVARRGVVVLDEVFGKLGPEEGSPPLAHDSLFPVSSGTKPLTATLVMQLVEEEPVRVGSTVTQYRFRAGGQLVKLMDYPDKPPQRPSGLYDGIGYRVLAFFVDDLDALIGRIEASGGRVAPGVDLPGKLRIRFAKDADGNMLELLGLDEPGGYALKDRVQVGMTVADVEALRAVVRG